MSASPLRCDSNNNNSINNNNNNNNIIINNNNNNNNNNSGISNPTKGGIGWQLDFRVCLQELSPTCLTQCLSSRAR